MVAIERATHYYVGQPELLQEAVAASLRWLEDRGFGHYDAWSQ
jgi:hypothetical protein